MVGQAVFVAAVLAGSAAETGGADAGQPPSGAKGPSPSFLVAPPAAVRSPERPQKRYVLTRAKDGSGDLVYDGDGFTARIARDGSVALRDRHFGVTLLPLLLGVKRTAPPKPPVPSLEEVIRGHRAAPPLPPSETELERSSTGYGSRLPIPEVTPYRPDPREACQYPKECFFQAGTVLVSVSTTFDLTDELMRLAGEDPYRVEKARFLTETRELRAKLAARAQAQALGRSARELGARIDATLCDSNRSVADRRALLEALRDEWDTSTTEGRAAANEIDRAMSRLRGAPDAGALCP